jgi:hypothetical protein
MGRDRSEDLDVDDKIKLKCSGWEGVDWVHLTQDRDLWQAVVNTLLNLRVP